MMLKIFSRGTVTFLLIGVLFLTNCAPKIVPDRVEKRKVYLTADPADLLAKLRERNRAISSLRTSKGSLEYRFTYSTRGYRGTDITFAMEKPGKVYARGSMTANSNVFTLKSDGERFWVEVPSDNEVYTGSVENQKRLRPQHNEDAELWQGFNPTVLSEALLLDDLGGDLQPSFETWPNYYIIHLFDVKEDGSLVIRRSIWISRKDLTVRRHRVFNEIGELLTEANLYQYVNVNGVELPQFFKIERPWEELSLELTLKDIKLNTELPEDIFNYEAPAGYKIIDLDKKDTENAESGES